MTAKHKDRGHYEVIKDIPAGQMESYNHQLGSLSRVPSKKIYENQDQEVLRGVCQLV